MTYGKRAVHAHKPIRSAGSIKEAVRLGAPAFRALNFHGSESDCRSAEVQEANVCLTRAFVFRTMYFATTKTGRASLLRQATRQSP